MKRVYAISLSLALSLTGACGKKKVEEKDEAQGQTGKSEQTGDATGNTTSSDPAVAEKLTVLYPPAIGVYPLSAPDPGRSLFFGFSSDGTQSFQMIWLYAVAAVPD